MSCVIVVRGLCMCFTAIALQTTSCRLTPVPSADAQEVAVFGEVARCKPNVPSFANKRKYFRVDHSVLVGYAGFDRQRSGGSSRL